MPLDLKISLLFSQTKMFSCHFLEQDMKKIVIDGTSANNVRGQTNPDRSGFGQEWLLNCDHSRRILGGERNMTNDTQSSFEVGRVGIL